MLADQFELRAKDVTDNAVLKKLGFLIM